MVKELLWAISHWHNVSVGVRLCEFVTERITSILDCVNNYLTMFLFILIKIYFLNLDIML